MYNRARIVRGWWGSLDNFDGKYKKQIESNDAKIVQDVYVYGETNYHVIQNLGFKPKLMSVFEHDFRLASNHTFWDHRSLLHKLKILQKSLQHSEEVLFLDWDMSFNKELDQTFYDSFHNSEFQVPLYLYPISEIEALIGTDLDRQYFLFFTKLNDYLKQHAWLYEDSYVIPNTGFIYCNDIKIADELMKIALKERLTTVPDELAVLFYMKKLGYTIEDYINNIEPSVISGKDCGNDTWNAKGKLLENYIETVKGQKKDIYLEHL